MRKTVFVGVAVGLLAVAAALLAVGCNRQKTPENQEYDSTVGSIYVRRDGSVTSTTVGVFDKEYYDLEEFSEYVKDIVLQYNVDTAGLAFSQTIETEEALPVALASITEEASSVLLKLDYASVGDYLAFNAQYQNLEEDVYFEICPVGGQQADISDDAAFIRVSDSAQADADTALEVFAKESKKTYFVGIDFATEIYTEGEILYVSDNVVVTGTNSATVEGGAPAYIVYR